MVSRTWPPSTWMGTRQVVKRVRDAWLGAAAMNTWLDAHVGPSTEAPDESEIGRFGPF
jgi:hypothetical protein